MSTAGLMVRRSPHGTARHLTNWYGELLCGQRMTSRLERSDDSRADLCGNCLDVGDAIAAHVLDAHHVEGFGEYRPHLYHARAQVLVGDSEPTNPMLVRWAEEYRSFDEPPAVADVGSSVADRSYVIRVDLRDQAFTEPAEVLVRVDPTNSWHDLMNLLLDAYGFDDDCHLGAFYLTAGMVTTRGRPRRDRATVLWWATDPDSSSLELPDSVTGWADEHEVGSLDLGASWWVLYDFGSEWWFRCRVDAVEGPADAAILQPRSQPVVEYPEEDV